MTEGKEEVETQPPARYLIRQPLALQWFDNGKLVKRCEQERQASKIFVFLHGNDEQEEIILVLICLRSL